jgi:hypothetical protein
MHKDFHLYGTYLAARLAGFDSPDAQNIACAAQAADDFTCGEYGSCRTTSQLFQSIICPDWKGEDKDLLETLWPQFHFLPAMEGGGLEDKFKTAPRGPFFNNIEAELSATFKVEKEILPKAFKLARIGIKMHVLADTYAHEGFSGLMSKKNIVSELKSKIGETEYKLSLKDHVPTSFAKISSVSSIGHGTAGEAPDISWIKYTCKTNSGLEIIRDNPIVFSRAFEKMVEILSSFSKGRHLDGCFSVIYPKIQSIRSQKMQQQKSGIFESRNDNVFMEILQKNLLEIRDVKEPGQLSEDYEKYLVKVSSASRDKTIANIVNSKEPDDAFFEASIWHRNTFMKKLSTEFSEYSNYTKRE